MYFIKYTYSFINDVFFASTNISNYCLQSYNDILFFIMKFCYLVTSGPALRREVRYSCMFYYTSIIYKYNEINKILGLFYIWTLFNGK